ncbi:response regulator receiver modulated diguanylate cyclase [Orenia metallireducens]|jgi:diguanylate cyclase (GGDEF)-like protein|uniref:Stage 0 sporulation protein A homolog n=1 Tax=Orenia metallireducens TaxID=1413210 RepID=A0A285GPR8_9FIRM|nr:GGDEF domain-containing response regulator [Orenia metallireducens]PRX29913.1 response regulator receiver modulated diguanylate cyclase [Orenia metallireducens]SNY25630.1 response regulator receiver modulated diguanylate cyclase [Orenia metallireducens]
MLNLKEIKLLLVEDNIGDARLFFEMTKEFANIEMKIRHEKRLEDGINSLEEEDFDIVLVDLGLPDSIGFDTLIKIRDYCEDLPIIVLTGLDDQELGIRAVNEGAQDYLVKGEVSANLLLRAIFYAIERHKLLKKLESKSITDELTKLYNRRGFLSMLEQQIKMAKRRDEKFLLVYADVDGLKGVNDNLGHNEGDRLITDAATVLKDTFRDSDIIGRIGGDEFVVISIDSSKESIELLKKRLVDKIKAHNKHENRSYQLSMSIGIVEYDPNHPVDMDELLKEADDLMYLEKQQRKKSKN